MSQETKNLKVLKIRIPGEVPEYVDTMVTETGEILYLEKVGRRTVPSKKNNKVALTNKKTGKAYIKLSEQYRKWQAEHKEFFHDQYRKFIIANVRLPVVRCKITMKFYFADNRARDTNNKEETILDELVNSGIIGDDRAQVVAKREVTGVMKKDDPRTEVYITIIEPGHPDYEYDQTDYTKYENERKRRLANNKRFQRAAAKSAAGKDQ